MGKLVSNKFYLFWLFNLSAIRFLALFITLFKRKFSEWQELEYGDRLVGAEMSKFCWSGFAPFTLNENARDSKVFAVSLTFGR